MSYVISVIVPIYNSKDSLIKSVDSIKKQNIEECEIILVDDGSTDGSYELCDCLAEQDYRIKVIHQPNGGVSKARNAGISCAKGDYITFLDSDDELADGFLANALDEMICNGFDIWCGTTLRLTDGIESGRNEVWEDIDGWSDELTEHQLIMCFNCLSCVSAKIYKRSILKGIFFDEESSFGEDMQFAFNIVTKCHAKIAFRVIVVYIYHFDGKGLASTVSINKCNSIVNAYHFLYDIGKDRGFSVNGEWSKHVGQRWLNELYYLENSIVNSCLPRNEKKKLIGCLLKNDELRKIAINGGLPYVSPGLWKIVAIKNRIKEIGLKGIVDYIQRRMRM